MLAPPTRGSTTPQGSIRGYHHRRGRGRFSRHARRARLSRATTAALHHPAQLPSPRPPCHRSTSTLISVSAASTTTLTDAPKGPLASIPRRQPFILMNTKGRSHPAALISLCTSHFDAPRVRQLGQFREARTPLIRLSVIADPHQHRLETGHSPSSVGCAKPSWTTHAASLMTMTP